MNPLSFFNSTSLLFLGVLVLCCALLFAYFESKAREQNHKISSMLSLVSSLTEEVQSIKRHIQTGGGISGGGIVKQMYQRQEENQQDDDDDDDLVSVSDDEGDDDDIDDDESDDSESDDSESDDAESDEGENRVIEIGENIKILTLLQPIELVSDDDDDNTECDADDLLDDDDLKSVSSKDEKEQANDVEEVNIFDLKSIHLEEPAIVDYKKLPVGKLRSIVAEKGIADDISRMKKPDLLKVLGVE